ncbi:hypothetical protein [Microvirga solisilvae]|uniref:hypothetical protein n=1 Tax=Microvirga solisilvae TaxID=2919498 RepID=UPI001FAF933E|nr:hypothetical protein [Microvirga solisilvae]
MKNSSHRNRPDTGGKSDTTRQGGMSHQESRDHNKPNEGGQSGHKPQKHSPAQEKH